MARENEKKREYPQSTGLNCSQPMSLSPNHPPWDAGTEPTAAARLVMAPEGMGAECLVLLPASDIHTYPPALSSRIPRLLGVGMTLYELRRCTEPTGASRPGLSLGEMGAERLGIRPIPDHPTQPPVLSSRIPRLSGVRDLHRGCAGSAARLPGTTRLRIRRLPFLSALASTCQHLLALVTHPAHPTSAHTTPGRRLRESDPPGPPACSCGA